MQDLNLFESADGRNLSNADIPALSMSELMYNTMPQTSRFSIGDQEFEQVNVVLPPGEDGEESIIHAMRKAGGVNYEAAITTQADYIRLARQIARNPKIAPVVEDIAMDIMPEPRDPTKTPIRLAINREEMAAIIGTSPENLDKTVIPAMNEAWREVMTLTKVKTRGKQDVEQIYTDAQMFFEKVMHTDIHGHTKIVDLVPINPMNIIRVRVDKEVVDRYDSFTGEKVNQIIPGGERYAYVYDPTNSKTFQYQAQKGDIDFFQHMANYDNAARLTDTPKIIPENYILHVPIGLRASSGAYVSMLYEARQPLNVLNLLEDSLVVLRVSKAPTRRLFSVDVAGLDQSYSEAFINQVQRNYINKYKFDPHTGNLASTRRFRSICDDMLFPYNSTLKQQPIKVDTLQGQTNFGDIKDIDIFRHNLYTSLRVIPGRYLGEDHVFKFVSGSREQSQADIQYNRRIRHYRTLLSNKYYLELMGQILVLSGDLSSYDVWNSLRSCVGVIFDDDNDTADRQEMELFRERVNLYRESREMAADGDISMETIKQKVFGMSSVEIMNERQKIIKETQDELKFLKQIQEIKEEIAMTKGRINYVESPEYQIAVDERENMTQEEGANGSTGIPQS